MGIQLNPQGFGNSSMRTKALTKRGAALFIALCILATASVLTIPTAAEASAAGGGKVVSYTCPAICADAGDRVDLGTFGVQFGSGKTTAADKISWTSADIEIKNGTVTPAAGIYLLTASAGSSKKTVVLTVRAKGEDDYLLYYNDFSSNTADGMRVIQETAGGKVVFSNDGVLTLDASASSSTYARVLLPEYLDGFGDLKIEASMKIDSAVNTKRWASIMLRLDTKKNYPYMQTAIRSSASLDNGTEIAERTSADGWNVTQKKASTIKTSDYNTYTADASQTTIKLLINGVEQLSEPAVMHTLGACGFQANGCRLTVDEVRITVGNTPNAEAAGGNIGGIADVRDPQSNIVLPPSIIYEVKTAADLEGITEGSPAVAVMNIDADASVLLDGGKKLSLDDAIAALDGSVIPALRPADATAARALAEHMKAIDYRDAFIISDDAATIAAGREVWYHLRGVLDLSARTADAGALDDLRGETNRADCRVMLLPAALATRDNVMHLQEQFMTVWVSAAANDDTTLMRAITTGANGVITGDRLALENCFTKYFTKGTLIRSPEIIGHRGVPSLAHENTIAGSLRAYELGATMIENDIHLTRDGVIVVMHNATIDATTNGKGAVASMTYEQLSKYSVISNKNLSEGEPIPTLEDYFKAFGDKDDVKLVVELKSTDPNLIPALVKLIRQYDYEDKMVVISFSEAQIKLFKEQMPEVSAGYLNSTAYTSANLPVSLYGILDSVQTYGTTFNPSYNKGVFDAELIRALSYRGVTVWPWTINSQEDLASYFAAGTYGITTNYSQYITNAYRKIYTDSAEYDLSTGEGPMITALTYGHKTVDITRFVTMKVIATAGTLDVSMDPVSGMLTYTGSGSADVIFSYSGKSNGKSYAKVTEVVTLRASDTTETTQEATAASGGCGSTISLSCAAVTVTAILGMGLTSSKRRK